MGIDRIVPSISYRNFLEDLTETRARIETETREISSGRRISVPSDNPAEIAKLLQFKDALAGLDQYGRNAATGRARLSYADSALDSAVNLMNTVLQRGTFAASDIQTPASRRAVGDEVTALRDQLLNLANSAYQGNFIFAGQQVSTAPFTLNATTGVVTYNGDSGVNQLDIGPGVSGGANVPGNQIFTAAGKDLFAALNELITALKNPAPSPPGPSQTTQITTALNSFTPAFEQLRAARTTVGSYLGAMDRAKQVLDSQRFQILSNIGGIEDTNMAESITRLVQDQTAESATLGIGARLSRRTLFDFIG